MENMLDIKYLKKISYFIILFIIGCNNPKKIHVKNNSINNEECDSIILDIDKKEYLLVGDLGPIYYSKVISTRNLNGKVFTEYYNHDYIKNEAKFLEISEDKDTLNYTLNYLNTNWCSYSLCFYPNGKFADFAKDINNPNEGHNIDLEIGFDSTGQILFYKNSKNMLNQKDSNYLTNKIPDWIEQTNKNIFDKNGIVIK